jgi:hypothetical protein
MTRALDAPQSRSAGLVQLLDEHHLVVLGESRERRAGFAAGLSDCLRALPDTQVINLSGDRATDLPSFCRVLAGALGVRRTSRPGLACVVDALRIPATDARRQYFIWEDADAMLEADVALFGRLVNAFLGVAAEQEHISPDLLVLQRVVFFGGDKLGAYAEDERGQFCSWLIEDDTTEFWEVASCVDRPPVLTYRLDG